MTLPEAHTFFHDTFKYPLNGMLDGMLMYFTGQPCLDPYKFDTFLRERHGDYMKDGLTMRDVVRNNYGEDAACKIQTLIGG